MREIRPMERDGQTKKNHLKRAVASKEEELQDRDLAPTNRPTTVPKVKLAMFLVQTRSNNNRRHLTLHKCPIQRHSYLSNSEQNLLPEVQEDSLV